MTKLYNEITLKVPIEKAWNTLSDLEALGKYDPTVKKSTMISDSKNGIGAKRKVDMVDGKNWFEEKISIFLPNEKLAFELTDCSFPIKSLQHVYTFEQINGQTKVKQVMDYTVKFGFLGKILDVLMIRKQSDKGVKLFFAGLKKFLEAD